MSAEALKKIISQSRNTVFFGGAGVSTESDIPDFRSENGIYKTIQRYGYPPETILSYSFFETHTEEFFDFYRNNMIYQAAKPNKAHLALAALEDRGMLRAVVTQNIDGLHQAAGSRNVLELHGSIHRNYCTACHERYTLEYVLSRKEPIPRCSRCNGIIKPAVTLYEESLDMDVVNAAVSFIAKADVLIVGGTSLVVYPAAGLIEYYRGGKLVLINKSATPFDREADLVIHDSIGKVLDEAVSFR